ncbi:MAG: hypothetical protein J6U16_06720 [Ruminococcus sp.]|nr:hypothetical protein [Ruminococcus sp.]
MKRFISAAAAALITVLLMLPLCTLSAFAVNTAAGWSGDSSLSCVVDDVGVYNDFGYALDQLNTEITAYSEKLQMNICIFIAGPQYRMSDSDEVKFCKEEYTRRFGADTDGIIFFIDMTGKRPAYDYMATSGKAILFYQEDVDNILDAACTFLPSSDSYSADADYHADVSFAIREFCHQLEKYQKDFRAGLKYYYDRNTDKYIYYLNGELKITKFKPPAAYLKSLLIALVGGGIAHIITFFIAKKNYKFKAKTNPNIYLAKDETRFSVNNDELIRSHTSKTHIPQSSGGGGGGSFRSGGGGGSFGGGGRHR